MSSEESSNTNQPQHQQEKPETYYQRKKNIFPGLDNEHLNFGLAAAGFILGAIAVFPMAKDFVTNFMARGQQLQQQQLPAPPLPPGAMEESYIPPTTPQNMNGHSQQQQQQPVEEQQKEEEQKGIEEEEDGLFHEQELRRRQKLLGQRARGSKYDSPFGKDIGGL